MKILLTGFEPFGGEKINPSWEAVRGVGKVAGVQLQKLCLPVEWRRAQQMLEAEIHAGRPDCVLLAGQAGGRAGVSLERVAINLCEASLPDNAGEKKCGEPIVQGGPDAYFATYPYREMLAALEKKDVPASFSLTAGAYLCNLVMYCALHLQATRYPGMRAGFIHLPYLPEQTADKPSMPLETQTLALEICVRAAYGQDQRRN